MIFLKFHDEDGATLVNLSSVASISEDAGVLNISMRDGPMHRVPGRMAAFEQALARVQAAPVTILEL